MSSTVRASSTSWWGLARPSGRTAVASPHTRPHSLAAKRSHRRRTRSVGPPVSVPSQPSIGRTAKRLGTVSVPATASTTEIGVRSGPAGSTVSATGMSASMPSATRRARNASTVRSFFICG